MRGSSRAWFRNFESTYEKVGRSYETKNGTNWDYNLPEQFHEKLLNVIVWFEFKVESIEAKFKLSQNRDKEDYKGVFEEFSKRASDNDKELFDYMAKTKKGSKFRGF